MLHTFQGQRFGKYQVGELLGEGGFSWVYRARDLEGNKDVALKIFKGFFPDQESLDELRHEEKIAQGLRHPHIVYVYQFAVEGDVPYVVMDYLPYSWRNEYAIGQALPLDLVVKYTRQLGEALQYAHDRRVVHRDLKPANLLLNAQKDVLLTDFGIARLLTPKGVDYTKHVAGTLHYMAPEAFQGQIGRACDQYSLGVMVYEWLTGRPPFEGNQAELLNQHFHVPPESLRVSLPGLSQEVDEVVLKALAKKPFQRFMSVQAFATKLEEAAFPGRKQLPSSGLLPREASQAPLMRSQELPASIWASEALAEGPGGARGRESSTGLVGDSARRSVGLPGREAGRESGRLDGSGVEPLQFRAFYPKEVAVENWDTLLVYTHVAAALGAVMEDAGKLRQQLGERQREASGVAGRPMRRGAELTIVPRGEGLTFNPARITFTWLEDWHQSAFRFRARKDYAGTAVNAEIVVYAGPLILAVLKMPVLCEGQLLGGAAKAAGAEASAQSYDRIFTSYSHSDTQVVQACRNAYQSLGFDVLIDLDSLRSGEDFTEALMRMIDHSDIFQLFWSPRSAGSAYVRKEWEYALGRGRGEGFIRPVYWELPLAPPPDLLKSIHFKYIELPKLTDAVNVYAPPVAEPLRERVCFRCEAANPPGSLHCGGCGYDLSGQRGQHDRLMGPSGRPYYARFWIMSGTLVGRRFTLHQDTTKIGRTSDNDVCIPDPTVSRSHALLRFEGGFWLVEDLGSHNSTFVNGVRTRTHVPQSLNDGDQLRFGDEMVMFQVVG